MKSENENQFFPLSAGFRSGEKSRAGWSERNLERGGVAKSVSVGWDRGRGQGQASRKSGMKSICLRGYGERWSGWSG
jgi:hypothetical protein